MNGEDRIGFFAGPYPIYFHRMPIDNPAVKRIKRDEELRLDYGEGYWIYSKAG